MFNAWLSSPTNTYLNDIGHTFYQPLIPTGDVYCQEIYLKKYAGKILRKEDTVLKEFS